MGRSSGKEGEDGLGGSRRDRGYSDESGGEERGPVRRVKQEPSEETGRRDRGKGEVSDKEEEEGSTRRRSRGGEEGSVRRVPKRELEEEEEEEEGFGRGGMKREYEEEDSAKRVPKRENEEEEDEEGTGVGSRRRRKSHRGETERGKRKHRIKREEEDREGREGEGGGGEFPDEGEASLEDWREDRRHMGEEPKSSRKSETRHGRGDRDSRGGRDDRGDRDSRGGRHDKDERSRSRAGEPTASEDRAQTTGERRHSTEHRDRRHHGDEDRDEAGDSRHRGEARGSRHRDRDDHRALPPTPPSQLPLPPSLPLPPAPLSQPAGATALGSQDPAGGGGGSSTLDAMAAAQKSLEESDKAKEEVKKKAQEPTFELSGKLADETNRVRGVTLQFTEPPEARKPTVRWRLYVFKDGEPLKDPLYIHRQTCYLFGRERKVVDIPTDHPSCSKQHAVIQFRLVEKEVDFEMKSTVRPYVMDLGSTNGTYLNGTRIEAQRYYELLEKDTLKFGNSSREYVLLHENSSA